MGKFILKTVNTGIKFDLKSANGQVILSSEVYTSEEACRKGIASVQKNAPDAPVEDQTCPDFSQQKHPKFELYQDKAGQFRFRLKARNGEIIGTSEGYTTKANCENGIASVQRNSQDASVETL